MGQRENAVRKKPRIAFWSAAYEPVVTRGDHQSGSAGPTQPPPASAAATHNPHHSVGTRNCVVASDTSLSAKQNARSGPSGAECLSIGSAKRQPLMFWPWSRKPGASASAPDDQQCGTLTPHRVGNEAHGAGAKPDPSPQCGVTRLAMGAGISMTESETATESTRRSSPLSGII